MSPYPNVHLYPLQDTMSNFASPPRLGLETKQGWCFPPACLCSPSQQRSMGTPKTDWEILLLCTQAMVLHENKHRHISLRSAADKSPRPINIDFGWKKTLEKKAENENWGGFIGQTNKQDLPFDKGSLARPDEALPCGDIRLMWWITWQAKQRRLMGAGRQRGY